MSVSPGQSCTRVPPHHFLLDCEPFKYIVFCLVLFSLSDEICGYTIYKSGVSPIPFKVVLLDRTVGSAKIVVAPGFQLNFEQKQSYDFDIAADDCITGAHGIRSVEVIQRRQGLRRRVTMLLLYSDSAAEGH